jgi:hypothetical protein
MAEEAVLFSVDDEVLPSRAGDQLSSVFARNFLYTTTKRKGPFHFYIREVDSGSDTPYRIERSDGTIFWLSQEDICKPTAAASAAAAATATAAAAAGTHTRRARHQGKSGKAKKRSSSKEHQTKKHHKSQLMQIITEKCQTGK